jgi:sec-independent protein translocase protein TatA
MPSLGAPELLIILAIVVVLFGATRIGDLGKSLGRGIRDFRSELRDAAKDDDEAPTVVVASTPEASRNSHSH